MGAAHEICVKSEVDVVLPCCRKQQHLCERAGTESNRPAASFITHACTSDDLHAPCPLLRSCCIDPSGFHSVSQSQMT